MKRLMSIKLPDYTRLLSLAVLVMMTAVLVVSQFTEAGQTATTMSPLEQRIAIMEDQQKTLDLAIEFGFDPIIVELTRKKSAEFFRENYCACTTWRFVKSEDELAYLMLSIIQTESRGNPRALGDSGRAHGLTQMWLTTAQMYEPQVTSSRLFTIQGNIEVSLKHFVDLLQKYHGNYTLAVIAWNRGSGSVDRAIAIGSSPENGYAYRVFTQAALRNAGN